MFSVDYLLHIAFADEADTYYCDSLMQLKLNEYLWLSLCEKYTNVYFLSASDDGFNVSSPMSAANGGFDKSKGGLSAVMKKIKKKAEAETFCMRMKELLSAKGERNAFVCPLEDFCAVFGEGAWHDALKLIADIKKRSGIIVLTASPCVSKTHERLLKSPVFDVLGISGVTDLRQSSVKNYYSSLKKSMGESVVFLNLLDEKNLRSLLINVMINRHGDSRCIPDIDTAAKYLSHCLTAKDTKNTTLFDRSFDTVNAGFSEIYDQLSNSKVWKKLCDECGDTTRLQNIAYCESDIRLCYEKNGFAWKCMRLTLDELLPCDEADRAYKERTLGEIRSKLSSPENKLENKAVCDKINVFLTELADGEYRKDSSTCTRAIKAIDFCVKAMYTSPTQQKNALEITKLLELCISYTKELKSKQNLLQPVSRSSAAYGIYMARMRQLNKLKEILSKFDEKADELILSFDPDGSERLNSICGEMSSLMDDFAAAREKLNTSQIADTPDITEENTAADISGNDSEKESGTFVWNKGLYDSNVPNS